ncbi:sensor histidine kinase [Austwickia sp. TVS 96-490-7B]|uniref:sensor histidine kinase n=1 Tax=Austwickia sp. TVS 96-490-7B TaxID=2830843 RepID=UPI001C572F93|nr:sensor histidine kinase [Austwickia sp. TVS 96-490-7B]
MPSVVDAGRRGGSVGWLTVGLYLVGATGYAVATFAGFLAVATETRPSRAVWIGTAVAGIAAVSAYLVIGPAGLALLPYLAVAVVAAAPAWVSLPIVGILVAGLWYDVGGVTRGADIDGVLIGTVIAAASVITAKFSAGRHALTQRYQRDIVALQIHNERNRMARDLHDILGHSLTVIAVKAELAGKLLDRDTDAARRELADVEILARAALSDVRATVNNYREVSLSAELVQARKALTDAGIRARLPGVVDDVHPDLRDLFAWTVREAVTNVVRHSRATQCDISVTRDQLTVIDNGVGPDSTATASAGHGLDGLRERARLAQARLDIGPAHPDSHSRPGFRLIMSADSVTCGLDAIAEAGQEQP